MVELVDEGSATAPRQVEGMQRQKKLVGGWGDLLLSSPSCQGEGMQWQKKLDGESEDCLSLLHLAEWEGVQRQHSW